MNTWESDHAAAIGKKVRELRGKRSAAWLSEETERLGLKLTRQTITDLENGRRRYVTTAELVVLAAALDVPGITLIYTELPDGDVEVLPGQHCSSIAALLNFSGELGSSTSDVARLAKLSRELFHERIRHEVRVELLNELVAEVPDGASDERVAAAADRIVAVVDKADDLRALKARIRQIPGAVVSD